MKKNIVFYLLVMAGCGAHFSVSAQCGVDDDAVALNNVHPVPKSKQAKLLDITEATVTREERQRRRKLNDNNLLKKARKRKAKNFLMSPSEQAAQQEQQIVANPALQRLLGVNNADQAARVRRRLKESQKKGGFWQKVWRYFRGRN